GRRCPAAPDRPAGPAISAPAARYRRRAARGAAAGWRGAPRPAASGPGGTTSDGRAGTLSDWAWGRLTMVWRECRQGGGRGDYFAVAGQGGGDIRRDSR